MDPLTPPALANGEPAMRSCRGCKTPQGSVNRQKARGGTKCGIFNAMILNAKSPLLGSAQCRRGQGVGAIGKTLGRSLSLFGQP
jgi:hypothetical protein